jgi:hypothetical protein
MTMSAKLPQRFHLHNLINVRYSLESRHRGSLKTQCAMDMSFATLNIDRPRAHVMLVTLNRPASANAMPRRSRNSGFKMLLKIIQTKNEGAVMMFDSGEKKLPKLR